MTSKTALNFWLDTAIFAILLVTTATGIALWRLLPHNQLPSLLGLPRQAWLSAHGGAGAFGLAGVVLHIIWHRDWLKALQGRSLRESPMKLRVNRVVDRAMWVCFIGANLCGALIAALHLLGPTTWAGVPVRLHVVLAVAWVVLTGVHLGLHRKWITTTARRSLPGSWQRAIGR